MAKRQDKPKSLTTQTLRARTRPVKPPRAAGKLRQAPSETVENYLKAVHALAGENPAGEAAMTRIAATLGVTTGTATAMAKKLAAAGLARYERFGGVRLTARGERAALDILRRHRLIETFLVQVLKLDWSDVHAEAERLEHAVSPRVVDAIDQLLGRPSVDPHGDLIPDKAGRTPRRPTRPLAACAPGERVRIARVSDQQVAFLAFVARHGLRPGALVSVLAADEQAQSVLVQAAEFPAVTLAAAAAGKVLVVNTPASRRE